MQAEFTHDSVGTVPSSRILSEIVKTHRTILPTGEQIEATSYIDTECGALLQRAVKAVKPKVGVEVGLAFGISTLYILEAMKEIGSEKLIGIDPAQHDNYWRGGGLHNIRRAGHESLYEFHEDMSQQVLPALAGEGRRIDFAFIDGWHTFDHVLIDFFYIDRMLNVGGVVVFDDVGYPSIRRACDFILNNRSYEVFDSVRLEINNSFNRRGKYMLNRLLYPFIRTDKSPGPNVLNKESEIDDVYFLALQKRSDDCRRWDHFVHF